MLAAATLCFIYHLEQNRFQSPLAAPIGVSWEKEKQLVGPGKPTPAYVDKFTLKNASGIPLKNVRLRFVNWASSREVNYNIGDLTTGESRSLLIGGDAQFRCAYGVDEVAPVDVVIVTCDSYGEKRVPMRDLGKERLLHEGERGDGK